MLCPYAMRNYLPTNSLVYKNIQTDSDRKVVFLSGLGLDIRKQREGFLRRFVLNQGVSYVALDYTNYVMGSPKAANYQLTQTFSQTMKVLAQDNKKLFLYGACYGGLMALKIAAQIPERTEAVLSFSPLHETPNYPWVDRALAFLERRENGVAKRDADPKILQQMMLFRKVFGLAAKTQGQEKIPTTYQGPVHLFHGQKDRLIPVENALQTQRVLNNPKCILHISPTAGHGLQNDFEMKAPIRILADHLCRV